MRRRTFLATLPLAAAGAAVLPTEFAAAQNPTTPMPLPKFQAPGEERFTRPDVHAGDRPSGASFSTRSPALGADTE